MLDIENSIFVVIDIQQKLVNAAFNGEIIVENSKKVANAANILSIPTVFTEQYPKGLGQTVERLKIANPKAFYVEKSAFSALKEIEFKKIINNIGRKQIVLCGIEGHICVLQTALDLVEEGYEVFVLKDCTSSRQQNELETAFDILKQYGIKIVTTEIVLFQWLKTSKNPYFKQIQSLIK